MADEGKTCGVIEWGLESYARVCTWQKELVAARKAGAVPDLLLLGEHPPVITLGRNAQPQNVCFPPEELEQRGVELHETERGGDVTYHGPGQLVGYPILDLSGLRKDVVWYLRSLEEVLIRAAREFGVETTRKQAPMGKRPLYTGVWAGEEKLAAIGIHISRWVTSHGFAFNVTTDLSYFDFIIPCGLSDKGVTSLAPLLGSGASKPETTMPSPQAPGGTPRLRSGPGGRRAERKKRDLMNDMKAAVVKHFGEVFHRQMIAIARDTWEAWLGAQQAATS